MKLTKLYSTELSYSIVMLHQWINNYVTTERNREDY